MQLIIVNRKAGLFGTYMYMYAYQISTSLLGVGDESVWSQGDRHQTLG